MKAYILHGIGDLQFEDLPMPEISDNEVLIEVKAAGICGSDIPRIYKTGAYSHPLIPGHEFSGKVVKAGKDAKEWFDKRIGVFPLIPCYKCEQCLKQQYEICKNYSYLGSRRNGGFAEYVAVPINNLIELPDNVTYDQAAMIEPMAVAVHAIRRISPRTDDRVAVCGLGTIGLFIAMFLKEMGVKNIICIGNKVFQNRQITKLGISDYRSTNDVNNINADVFFECVGKNETVNLALNNTNAGGKIMLVGNPYSDMNLDKSTYWKILRNQLTVMGTWNSSFMHSNSDDWNYVLTKLEDKKISPEQFITHKYSIENLTSGFQIMRDKSDEYVKIMMCKR